MNVTSTSKVVLTMRAWLCKYRAARPDASSPSFTQPTGTFPFLRLPSEIRNLIYRELLLCTYPLIMFFRSAFWFEISSRAYPAILQTNRQIHDEAAIGKCCERDIVSLVAPAGETEDDRPALRCAGQGEARHQVAKIEADHPAFEAPTSPSSNEATLCGLSADCAYPACKVFHLPLFQLLQIADFPVFVAPFNTTSQVLLPLCRLRKKLNSVKDLVSLLNSKWDWKQTELDGGVMD